MANAGKRFPWKVRFAWPPCPGTEMVITGLKSCATRERAEGFLALMRRHARARGTQVTLTLTCVDDPGVRVVEVFVPESQAAAVR